MKAGRAWPAGAEREEPALCVVRRGVGRRRWWGRVLFFPSFPKKDDCYEVLPPGPPLPLHPTGAPRLRAAHPFSSSCSCAAALAAAVSGAPAAHPLPAMTAVPVGRARRPAPSLAEAMVRGETESGGRAGRRAAGGGGGGEEGGGRGGLASYFILRSNRLVSCTYVTLFIQKKEERKSPPLSGPTAPSAPLSFPG